MDKKSTWSNLTPAKQSSSNSDCKKIQDGTSTSKGFNKGPRKREGNQPALPKNESFHRRGKAFDKRPKPRSQYNDDRKEDSQVKERTDDFDLLLYPERKKVNLNHLLNFHYAPKDAQRSSDIRGHHYKNGPHRFNKEQFLQANCQFVVKAGEDYSKHLNDADALVQWDSIEQIRVLTSAELSCPICLCKPTAARMTKCGHVYCWPCMLHYLALGEKSSRKCPICYENVKSDDLKSVEAVYLQELKVGDIVKLRLMRREKGSTTVQPVEDSSETTKGIEGHFCKLIFAKPNEVLDILKNEGLELQERFISEEQCPEQCFTMQAMDLLEQRKTLVTTENSNQPMNIATAQVEEGNYLDEASNASLRDENYSRSLPNSEMSFKSGSTDDDDACFPSQGRDESRKFYYFYQAEDGQQVYLHALNVHMLEHMYGSLAESPTVIKGLIVEKDAESMTLEMRHRLRYLQHLPVTCQFEIVELEFRPPVVCKQTLEFFREQVDTRKKKRQQRARKERRIEKRNLEEENKRMGKYPMPNVSIESLDHFPECSTRDDPSFMPLMEEMEALSVSPSVPSGPSFSQMLKVQTGRKLNPVAPTSKKIDMASDEDKAHDLEGSLPPPSFAQSFGDSIMMALQQVESSGADIEAQESGQSKRKKKKPKILFTTNMTFNSK